MGGGEGVEPLRRGDDAKRDPVERRSLDGIGDSGGGGVALRELALAIEGGGADEPRNLRWREARRLGLGLRCGRARQRAPWVGYGRQGAGRRGVELGQTFYARRQRRLDDRRRGSGRQDRR